MVGAESVQERNASGGGFVTVAGDGLMSASGDGGPAANAVIEAMAWPAITTATFSSPTSRTA
jgi:hypothetical protein